MWKQQPPAQVIAENNLRIFLTSSTFSTMKDHLILAHSQIVPDFVSEWSGWDHNACSMDEFRSELIKTPIVHSVYALFAHIWYSLNVPTLFRFIYIHVFGIVSDSLCTVWQLCPFGHSQAIISFVLWILVEGHPYRWLISLGNEKTFCYCNIP